MLLRSCFFRRCVRCPLGRSVGPLVCRSVCRSVGRSSDPLDEKAPVIDLMTPDQMIESFGPLIVTMTIPRLLASCFWMGGCIFHYNQDHRLNSGSITDLVCLTHDPDDDNAALVCLIGCSFRFRGYAPAELEITIRIDHSSMNTYTHCCASKLCFALPCYRDVTRGAPSPESNDPTRVGATAALE